MIRNNATNEDIERVTSGTGVLWFTATWCGPCRAFAPVIDKVFSDTETEIVKVDIDEYPDVSGALGVLGVPTLMFFKNEVAVETRVGLTDEASLRKLLKTIE